MENKIKAIMCGGLAACLIIGIYIGVAVERNTNQGIKNCDTELSEKTLKLAECGVFAKVCYDTANDLNKRCNEVLQGLLDENNRLNSIIKGQ